MAAIPSFIFGGNAPARTPQEAARNRQVYEALVARNSAPKDLGEGLTAVGNAWVARTLMDRAAAGEEAGSKRVAELVAGFQDGADQGELLTALSDPWLSENAGGSAVAKTLLERELQKGDPAYQLEMEKSQLELDAMRNPVPKAPDVQTIYDPVTGTEKKVQWNAETGAWDDIGGTKATSNGLTVQTNPDGTATVTQGGPGKISEAQGKGIAFYTRGIEANKDLAGLEGQLTDLGQSLTKYAPLGLGNYARTPEFRQAKVAADQFLAAILRKDTGAAVTPQEFDLYGPMFLPIPGDDPATIEQKRRMREVALLAIKSELGTAEAVATANQLVLGIDSATPTIDAQASPAMPEEPAVPDPTATATITNDAEYDALPPGTVFVGPDGKKRKKP
jgi:hypothetical protein